MVLSVPPQKNQQFLNGSLCRRLRQASGTDGRRRRARPGGGAVATRAGADLPRILKITNEAIANTAAVWSIKPATLETRRTWLLDRQGRVAPIVLKAARQVALISDTQREWATGQRLAALGPGGWSVSLEHPTGSCSAGCCQAQCPVVTCILSSFGCLPLSARLCSPHVTFTAALLVRR